MKNILLCLCLFFALSARAAEVSPTAAIHRDIDKLVALYTDGFGSNKAKSRFIVFGPLFNPESSDAIAFFTLNEVDLTNGYEEYIAVFAQGQGRRISGHKTERLYRLVATARVGTRWTRSLEWKTAKISQGRIAVKGLRWSKNDAGCCPTEPIEVIFNVITAEEAKAEYPYLHEDEKPQL